MPTVMTSVQVGAHPRSSKVELINNFVILVISAPKLVMICYCNVHSSWTVDRCKEVNTDIYLLL